MNLTIKFKCLVFQLSKSISFAKIVFGCKELRKVSFPSDRRSVRSQECQMGLQPMAIQNNLEGTLDQNCNALES